MQFELHQEATEKFVHTTLEHIRRGFIESGQQDVLAILLVRQNPNTDPPTVFSPPVIMTLPMVEDAHFPTYLGIVSSLVAPWRAASVFLVVPGWLVEEGGKKTYLGCNCDGKHPDAERALFTYFEHETLPRRAWYASVGGDPPQSVTLGNWTPTDFPPRMTLAFPRTN